MPRTPTQRAHPASAVHPYGSPAQPAYDRPPHLPSSSTTRSPDLSRSDWQMKAEHTDDSARAQGSASTSGTTPSTTSQPGPSTSPSQSTASAVSSAADAKLSSTNGSTQQAQAAANNAKKKHVCPTCDRGFTTSGHLARHARVHTGERNHKCPFPGCETRCSRQDNLQQHYRIHLSPGSRRSASSAARAAAQNKAAVAAVAASAIATSPVQTSPVGTLGPDDGPPPLAQAIAGAGPSHPPQLAQAPQPYSHGPMPYPPTPMTAIPHASPHVQQHAHSGYMPHTPPNAPYEVGQQAQIHQNGLGNGNGAPAPALAHSPPESPASHGHSTPSTGPSAHVPLPPSSYSSHSSYMGYSGYSAGPPGPAPKISTFYQRHHYPPEAYHNAHTSSAGQVSTQTDGSGLGTNGGLHPVDQLGEKERRKNRPSISSISSGQSPSQSPIITNGRAERVSMGDANAWASAPYVSYQTSSGSPATTNGTANGDGSYGIGATNSYAAYAHQHSHPHYEVHSPPPLPPPQSTASTNSSASVGSSLLSDGSHASSHTSYSTLSSHQNQNPNRSPPPILAPIQSSLRGDLGGMGMHGYHAAMPSMRHHIGHGGRGHGHYSPGAMSYTHPQPLPQPHTLTAGAAESGYSKGYDV